MSDFKDKFKAFVDKAQKKVTEIQNDEKVKEAVQQIQTKATEYQKLAQEKISDYQSNVEKQKLEKAANHLDKKEFTKAIAILEKIQSGSEVYEEAQKRLFESRENWYSFLLEEAAQNFAELKINEAVALINYIPIDASAHQKALRMIIESAIKQFDTGYPNHARATLKTLSKECAFFQEAQEKLADFEKQVTKTIEKNPYLLPINYNDKIVAGVEVDSILYIIDKISKTSRLSTSIESKSADGQYLIVKLFVSNKSKETRQISAEDITLIDSESREFSTSTAGQLVLAYSDNTAGQLVTQIQPGLDKYISIVFDVPPEIIDIETLKLKVPGENLFGRPDILPFSLALLK